MTMMMVKESSPVSCTISFCLLLLLGVQGFLHRPSSLHCSGRIGTIQLGYSNRDDDPPPSFDRFSSSSDNNNNNNNNNNNDKNRGSGDFNNNKLELKWNLRNLFSSTTSSSEQVGGHLKEIYKAAQEALSAAKFRSADTSFPHDADEDQQQPVSLKHSELEKVRRFLKSYPNDDDMSHDGRFGVGDDHFSLQANLVFSMDQPLRYIQQILSFPPAPPSRSSCEDEVVVFCPGLHTPSSQSTRQQEYLSQVLDGIPISLLQVGTHQHQQQEIEVQLTADAVLALRTSNVMVEEDSSTSPIQGGLYRLQSQDLDVLRSIVAWQQSPSDVADDQDENLVETLVKLVDVAVESVRTHRREPHLVLVAYSATARAVSAALDRWKQMATSPNLQLRNRGLGPSKAEALLRQAVTVVTLGGLCRSYPDGPAYVHLSMYDDSLVAQAGAGGAGGDVGGGKDAVVLQALSPYDVDVTADDATASLLTHHAPHNPQASTIQFLSLVMRINGIGSFQQLYRLGSQPTPKLDISPQLFTINYISNKVGELDLPNDDLLVSMIRATGGHLWLQVSSSDQQPIDDDEEEQEEDCCCGGVLPDLLNAQATIAEHFGYGVYEEISEACCGTRSAANNCD